MAAPGTVDTNTANSTGMGSVDVMDTALPRESTVSGNDKIPVGSSFRVLAMVPFYARPGTAAGMELPPPANVYPPTWLHVYNKGNAGLWTAEAARRLNVHGVQSPGDFADLLNQKIAELGYSAEVAIDSVDASPRFGVGTWNTTTGRYEGHVQMEIIGTVTRNAVPLLAWVLAAVVVAGLGAAAIASLTSEMSYGEAVVRVAKRTGQAVGNVVGGVVGGVAEGAGAGGLVVLVLVGVAVAFIVAKIPGVP